MIFIRRDAALIPKKVLDVALRAQSDLEKLSPEKRKEFIKKKSYIWRGFSKYLAKMSYGKCWYSEAKDAGANFDVDHFRPKAEARRTEETVDADGYSWLAFDWDNFRLSAQNCNRLNTDDKGETHGKGSWFPLLQGSPKASWDNRCIENEMVVLLDPVLKTDLIYIDYDDNGRFKPSQLCVGIPALRVRSSAIFYGLNLEKMREARFEVMKDAKELFEIIQQSALELEKFGDDAPMRSIERQIEQLRMKTRADAPFSRAVRTQLIKIGADDYLIDRSLDAE
ncbi:TPA: HNH endonuclease [Enterobacter bugandensis]|uniref:HNH endonuclease n=1 Tax=Enterobacter TaxID=547 RepID=UPI000F88D665|nr:MULTISPECIES: hypothetical protein [Enterobacter]EHN8828440.1 hypothetical protein [Enterobacter bugandensis]EHN8846188.1 hypothetical protein [Enterobacter bugandensis]EHN8848791.1 hypothetical protein [Enterobacter bugandensis]MBE4806984.1 hypothetical protein [Enterobacter cloacae complex sp. P43RS]MCK6702628.1 hypothetical protein [Enterobacter bugandensis]